MMDSKRKWNYWILLLLACVSKTSNRSKDRSGSPSALVKEMHQMVAWQAKCIQMLCHTHSDKGNQIRNSRSKIHTATSFHNFKFQHVSVEAAFRPSSRKTSWPKWCVSHHCYYSPGDSRLASPFVSWLLRRDLGSIVSEATLEPGFLEFNKCCLKSSSKTLVGINIYDFDDISTIIHSQLCANPKKPQAINSVRPFFLFFLLLSSSIIASQIHRDPNCQSDRK